MLHILKSKDQSGGGALTLSLIGRQGFAHLHPLQSPLKGTGFWESRVSLRTIHRRASCWLDALRGHSHTLPAIPEWLMPPGHPGQATVTRGRVIAILPWCAAISRFPRCCHVPCTPTNLHNKVGGRQTSHCVQEGIHVQRDEGPNSPPATCSHKHSRSTYWMQI